MKLSTLKSYLSGFEGWVRADEFRGAAHPDARDEIHDRYKKSKRRLVAAIERLAS